MTDSQLSQIPALHAVAREPDGQKSLSRRSLSIFGVVLIHAIFLMIFFIPPPAREIEPAQLPLESILLLSSAKQDKIALPNKDKDKDIPKGNSRPLNTAPITIPPPKSQSQTQQEQDEEAMSALGRALACTAGQYEYLAESARRKCAAILVPWKLDSRDVVLSRQFKPTDPNKVELHLDAAESNRRINETSSGCVPGASGPAADACRALHPGGIAVQPSGLGVKF